MKILMIGLNIQSDVFPLGWNYMKGYVADMGDDIIVRDFS